MKKVTVNKRVLIIDDEDIVREIVQYCLEEVAGWNVVAASSGREGLVKVTQEKLDAIVLDIMMPGMDGLTFLKRLKANPEKRSIPVVLLTAKVEFTDPQKFSGLGVAGGVCKPFDPLLLSNQIATALGWSLEA